MGKIIKENIVFIEYALINGVLTGAYFLLYYLFIEFLNMNYMAANAISYVITVLAAYYMTRVFVFQSQKDGKKEFLLFVIVRVAMVAISSSGLWMCANLLHMGKYISFILVNGVCFVASYAINKKIFTGTVQGENT